MNIQDKCREHFVNCDLFCDISAFYNLATKTPHPSIANAGLFVVLSFQRANHLSVTNLSLTLTLVSDAAHCTPCFPTMGYRRTLSAVALYGLYDPVCHEPVTNVNDSRFDCISKITYFRPVVNAFLCIFHKIFTV